MAPTSARSVSTTGWLSPPPRRPNARCDPAPAVPPPACARRGGTQRITTVEVCFDLVYVFAITHLSHLVPLPGRLRPRGDLGAHITSVRHAQSRSEASWS